MSKLVGTDPWICSLRLSDQLACPAGRLQHGGHIKAKQSALYNKNRCNSNGIHQFNSHFQVIIKIFRLIDSNGATCSCPIFGKYNIQKVFVLRRKTNLAFSIHTFHVPGLEQTTWQLNSIFVKFVLCDFITLHLLWVCPS